MAARGAGGGGGGSGAAKEEARLASLLFGDVAAPVAPALAAKTRASEASAGRSSKARRTAPGQDAVEDAEAAGRAAKRAGRARGGGDAAAASTRAASSVGAWVDEDDEAIQVGLAKTARLRKLRTSDSETHVSGAEFSDRLRARFEATAGNKRRAALAGAGSDWAALPTADSKRARKARKRDEATGEVASDSEDGSEREEGDDEWEAEDVEADGEADDADEARLLRSAGPLVESRSAAIKSGTISMSRVRDANRAHPAKAVIQAATFHPSGAVLATGGLDKRLSFFAIDGSRNAKVASVHFPDMPIAAAEWTRGGNEVIVAGRRPYFYTYDVERGASQRVNRILGRSEKSLESVVVQPDSDVPGAGFDAAAVSPAAALMAFLGNDGNIILVSQHTKTWVSTLKMNGSVRGAVFARALGSSGGTGFQDLLTVGGDGEVYRWDMRTMSCIERHADEGSTGATSIAASPDGSTYAVGSTMGVVNMYDSSLERSSRSGAAAGGSLLQRALAGQLGSSEGSGAAAHAGFVVRKPVHTVMNLTTAVSGLTYSHDGQLLVMSSQRGRDSMRVVHCASGTVFSNWPTARTPLHYVTATDFSPHSGYLAVGNDKGRVLLYRVNHYQEA